MISPATVSIARRFSLTLGAVMQNLANTGRGRKQIVSMVVDYLLSAAALALAYALRFGNEVPEGKAIAHLFLLIPVASVLIFSGLGVYRWVVRSTNRRLFRQLLKGVGLSALLLVMITHLVPPEGPNSRSLFMIYGIFLLAGVFGVRTVWRALFAANDRGEPIAIYGAGSAGRQLLGSLEQGSKFRPTIFIDDDPLLIGSLMSGLPVVSGRLPELAAVLLENEISRVVLAMPSLGNAAFSDKVEALRELELPLLTVPDIAELAVDGVRANAIRDISIKDILGRQEVPPDFSLLGRCVTGKSVLVTGGGGSIGSELCRQILSRQPARLVVLDSCEENLYHISEELSGHPATCSGAEKAVPVVSILGSVTNEHRMRRLIGQHAIDTVYHAAACKHVPIVEAQPEQGAETNIFGTLATLEAALDAGVDHFVLISTDKAVRPSSAMGATKRIAELILQAKADAASRTRICMVRFGNVLGSSGSVVPKFKAQIEAGGPITITDTDITRYFMTIPEAAQLVMQASAIARGGDVFVLDMGQPVRIEDMARRLVHLYGKRLAKDTNDSADIQIVISGLRPGEKMYEELFIAHSARQTQVTKVSTAQEAWLPWERLQHELNHLRDVLDEASPEALRARLHELATATEQIAPLSVQAPGDDAGWVTRSACTEPAPTERDALA